MLAYLCGPIEYAEDGGRLWRRKLAPYLREQLGHRVYDPAEDERKNLTRKKSRISASGRSTDLDRFRRVVRKIIAFDLEIIENASRLRDLLLGRGGAQERRTSAELTVAHRKGIPVYLVTARSRRRNQRMDAGMFGPDVWVHGRIERIPHGALCARKTEPSLERLIESAADGENSGRGRQHRRPKVNAVMEALNAVRAVCDFLPSFEVVGIEVPSGVRHTPLSSRGFDGRSTSTC